MVPFTIFKYLNKKFHEHGFGKSVQFMCVDWEGEYVLNEFNIICQDIGNSNIT
jgi:hypothetical protein